MEAPSSSLQRAVDDRQPNAEAWRVSVSGVKLSAMVSALKSMAGCMKNPLLTFWEEGMIVQGSVCGQRVFIPVASDDFTEYRWQGPPAIFLAITDSKRTLMDPFKQDKKRIPTEITFNFHGNSPSRNLTQTVTYAGSDSDCTYTTTVVKYELWTSSVMCPTSPPDVTFSVNKQQLSRIVGLASKLQHEELVFALKSEGGLFIGTVCEVISFAVDGSAMTSYPYSGQAAAVTTVAAACGRRGRDSNSTPVVGHGSGKPFCMALEDTSAFKSLIQKIRPGANGVDLRFYTSTDVPMLCVRLHTPASPSAFLFCTSDCISIHELEEVSAVAGAVKVVREGPQSRKSHKRASQAGHSLGSAAKKAKPSE
uniref:DNA polymerase processivity factor n=1 Tax=Anatid alphaherpesvirus 2 TaxID=3080522 RepID=A0AAU0K722_9ALPH